MFLRPGELDMNFIVERRTSSVNNVGRTQISFTADNTLHGVLSNASCKETERWKQQQHPVTHTIVAWGNEAECNVGDRLVLKDRFFYVQGVDNISSLDMFTLYYVEERSEKNG